MDGKFDLKIVNEDMLFFYLDIYVLLDFDLVICISGEVWILNFFLW